MPRVLTGAVDRDRTDDLILTMDVLYRLSYNGNKCVPILDEARGTRQRGYPSSFGPSHSFNFSSHS